MPQASAESSLSIVIVSWQCGQELAACVESLAAARRRCRVGASPIELIVVDNASDAFDAHAVTSHWPDATIVHNDANRGFGPAANQGAALACGENVLFLNPDTRALDDALTPLCEAFATHPNVVAVAPRLFDETPGDEPQERFQLRRLPTWRQALRELLLIDRAFPGNAGLRRDRYLDCDRDAPFEVEQPAAAALAVRRDAFAGIGGFDERFVPAWFEDVDLCARLRGQGAILYWPASRFLHGGRTARETLGYDRFLPIYHRNAIRYWRKQHGAMAAFTFRLLVAAGMVLRLVALPLLGRLQLARRTLATAYLRVLMDAFETSSRPARGTS
jgi:hypothetical protein